VLLCDARVPLANELPKSIRPLAELQNVQLTHRGFRAETDDLVKRLQEAFKETRLDALEQDRAAMSKGLARPSGPVSSIVDALPSRNSNATEPGGSIPFSIFKRST
jgi:hypothetical protein